MLKILVTLVFALSSNLALAYEKSDLPDNYKEYFNKLDLPYERPVGTVDAEKTMYQTDAMSSVLTDFNGDGTPDFAGIYRYTGSKKRIGRWNLDLVIIYSSNGSTKHVIYPYFGRYDEERELLLEYLTIHDKGVVDLMPGKLVMERPGIITIRKGKPNSVIYWDKGKFSRHAMGVDD